MIVGGGVSGLATAYFLAKQGIRSTIVEKSERLGGLIQTDRVEGCDLEAGPDSYVAAKPWVTQLAGELGIQDRIIGSNDAQRRIFIVRHGKLRAFPKGMVMMAPAEWGPVLRSPLFSAATKLQFIRERFMPPRKRDEDVSIQQFVTEHFGREVLDMVTEPLLSGVYGGEAGRLSARSVLPRFMEYEAQYGSLIRGVRMERKGRGFAPPDAKRTPHPFWRRVNPGPFCASVPQERLLASPGSLFLSFAGGMQTFSDALRGGIQPAPEIVRGEAVTIDRQADSWRVRVSDDWIDAAQVVLACPAHASAGIVSGVSPQLSLELSAIPYSSAILVMLLFRRAELTHPLNGFGFLTPPSERKVVAAATFINTKFPSRIANGIAAIRCFLVGRQAEELMPVAESDLLRLIREDLGRLMGVTAEPIAHTIHRWPQSMPQYIVGHADRCRRIGDRLLQLSGLYVTSNAFDGVGVPDCVRLAKETANFVMLRARI